MFQRTTNTPLVGCPHAARRGRAGAFTLVEILIVVVILGILASIVIPNFTRSTDEAKTGITYSELMKIRRHVEMFRARNAGALPAIIDGSDGNWGALVGRNSEYLQGPPTNAHVGGANGKKIRFGTGPDSAFQTDYGWIVDPATGNVWAGSFDGDDRPLTP